MTESVDLTREYAAAPHRLWTAWTTRDGLVRWWWRHWPGVTCDVDLRVGGHWRIEAPGQKIAVHGTYTRIDEPTDLGFTWIWSEDGIDGPVEHVEVTFAAHGDGTHLRVRHSGIADLDGMRAYEQGWAFTLTQLHDRLGEV
ncbi:SRPBCC family protein [Luteipulveratus halotolerans]|nr:SRPBCC domain-containing protein [Luteipulveratus halotolerans]